MNKLSKLLYTLKNYSLNNANNANNKELDDLLSSKSLVDKNILGIEDNSSLVKEGFIFVAIKGYTTDGHEYINDAIAKGACCVIVEKSSFSKNAQKDSIIVPFTNTKIALALLLKKFYDDPSSKLKLIGVTGTNGKTTITYMLKSIMEAAKEKVGVIGTIANYIGDKKIKTNITTPDSPYLNKTLFDMQKAGVRYCFMEVTSHALVQNRVFGLNFDLVILTNITEDHFDFHGNMQKYYEAKKLVFKILDESTKKNKLAVINANMPFSKDIISYVNDLKLPLYSYGLSSVEPSVEPAVEPYYSSYDIKCDILGSSFSIKKLGKNIISNLLLLMPGKFNVVNALASFISASFFGIDNITIKKGLATTRVSGRFELIKASSGAFIVIDYAHTDDALKNVLEALRGLTKHRVICVFGCGGNRDRLKRRLMGNVAASFSDLSIVTSDNPRKEEPKAIIEDIMEGIKEIKGASYIKITDRRAAIEHAISEVKKGEIVLIAGKGHEDYQILEDKTIYFSDKEVVLNLIQST